MDQQTLVGIGILVLLLASAGGGGGDVTELIDEDDPALTGGLDQFEQAAVDYERDVHGPDSDNFDQYLGSVATRVHDWTAEFSGFKGNDPSGRLTQRIFAEMTDLHQELKKWFAEKLSRWNTWWRRKWEDPHPKAAYLFDRYGQIVKQLDFLLSLEVDDDPEEDTTMGAPQQIQLNQFNQHIAGSTYIFPTNNLTDARVNNDFRHHDLRTMNFSEDSYFDDRKYDSKHSTLNWGAGKMSVDCDNAVETTKRREKGKSIPDNAFVAHVEPLRMKPAREGTKVTATKARVKHQDLVNIDDPNREDHKFLRLTAKGEEKSGEAEPGINAIVEVDPEAPNLADVREQGVSIRTDADHFANAAVKVISTRKTIGPPPLVADPIPEKTPPSFVTIPDRTGAGIDLNRPTGVVVTTDNIHTSPPIASEDKPEFSAAQPKVGVDTKLQDYKDDLATKVRVFDRLEEQFKHASNRNKWRIYHKMEVAMNDIAGFTPPEISQRIQQMDSRFDKGFESMYHVNLKDLPVARQIQIYAKSTAYFKPWHTRTQHVFTTFNWVKSIKAGTIKMITAGGEEEEGVKTIGTIPPTGFTRTAEEAGLDDPQAGPADDPDEPDVDEPQAKKTKAVVPEYRTKVVDPRPRDFPDEPFGGPDPTGMGHNGWTYDKSSKLWMPGETVRNLPEHTGQKWNPHAKQWEQKTYLPASQVHGQSMYVQ